LEALKGLQIVDLAKRLDIASQLVGFVYTNQNKVVKDFLRYQHDRGRSDAMVQLLIA
jgi:hypothetical protein